MRKFNFLKHMSVLIESFPEWLLKEIKFKNINKFTNDTMQILYLAYSNAVAYACT